jgi:large subunit ribosomal protein L4
MAVAVYTKTGTKATGAFTLPKSVFDEEIKNHALLQEAFVAHHAGLRANTASSLDRGEVRGGGKKPWQQKGLGRARAGSIRSPIWRGGGITFGPTLERNYIKKINRSARQKAIRQALTLSAQDGSLSIIEDFALGDTKTKSAAQLIAKLGVASPLLLVVDKKTDDLLQATRNIARLTIITAKYLSVYQIARHAHILVTKPAVAELESWLARSPARSSSASVSTKEKPDA